MSSNTVLTLQSLNSQQTLAEATQLADVGMTEAFTGQVNAWYKTTRHNRTTSIFLLEVKKQTVYYKDKPEDQHIQNMPLARFLKFYRPTGGRT